MNNKKRVAMGYVFLLPALILFMVVVAYPVFNTLKTSFGKRKNASCAY